MSSSDAVLAGQSVRELRRLLRAAGVYWTVSVVSLSDSSFGEVMLAALLSDHYQYCEFRLSELLPCLWAFAY